MPALGIFMLAFSPGIFWLWLIYTRDKYRPEPRLLVIRTFLLGAAVSVPVTLIEFGLYPGAADLDLSRPVNIATAAYLALIVAGVTEEIGKYAVVRYTIYNSPYFDEPMDGLVYASAAALGFASLENVGYMLTYGWEIIAVRGPFSTLAHVLFSGIWGYLLGRQKIHPGTGRALLIAGLTLSIILHGAFDFLLLSKKGYEMIALVVFVGSGIGFMGLINLANKQSPYKDKVGSALVRCSACGHKSGYYAGFCNRCGSRLTDELKQEALFCSQCDAPLVPQSYFCNSCGSRLNRKKWKP